MAEHHWFNYCAGKPGKGGYVTAWHLHII